MQNKMISKIMYQNRSNWSEKLVPNPKDDFVRLINKPKSS